MSSFDLCCPGNSGKAPDSPGKRGYADELNGAMSDDDSFGPSPPPPPPDEPYPDNLQAGMVSPDGDKFNDEYDDADRAHDMEKGSDPPQETTQDLSEGEMDDEEYEEDLSVEIPPTKVVQRMIEEDDDDEKAERGGRTLCMAGIVACCLVVAALVLGIGFGTGKFTKEESTARSFEPPTNVGGEGSGVDGGADGGADGGLDGGATDGGADPEPPVVFTDPDTLAGLGITDFIPAVSLSDQSIFEDVESPEYLAMNYLVTASEEGDSFDTNLPEDRARLVQMYSLLTLWYSSTDAWVDETGWVQTPNACEWTGITCDELGVTVVEIDMNGNGLTGTIPRDLALLSGLRSLSLSNNNIMGPIPSSLFAMSNLEEIYIDNNIIEHEVTNVSGLESLTVFYASDNNLSGDVSVFWDLVNLKILVLDDNSFTGTLDGISALQNLCKCSPD